jgi:ABC-type multidrug transport system ATPase subunit
LVTILGQNGAGKTTLINILTGYLEPSWGEAWIAGRTLTDNTEEIREITSLCPQFDIYWPNLTIEEHLRLFSVIKGLHDSDTLKKEVQRTLKLVGLTEKKDERVEFLSGGMRRRLAIAISTISDPEIIFFDEPTTGLDPVTKDQILNLIKGKEIIFILFHKYLIILGLKKGKTLVLTTHSMEEADELSDSVIFLNKGKKFCQGSPMELKMKYGGGLSLILQTYRKEDSVQVRNAVTRKFSGISLKSCIGERLEFEIPKDFISKVDLLVEFVVNSGEVPSDFSNANSSGIGHLIDNWNLSEASMEALFYKLHNISSAQNS